MTYEEFVADPLREIERMGEIIAANEAVDPGFYADPAITTQVDGELSIRSLTVAQKELARRLAFTTINEQRYLASVPAIPAPRPRSTTSNTLIWPIRHRASTTIEATLRSVSS